MEERPGGRTAAGEVRLKCLYTNANSIVGKMAEFRQRMDGIDVAGITESWANEYINDAELHVDGFNMFRTDRVGAKGGGLLLYVSDRLEATYNHRMNQSNFNEAIWCNITLAGGRLLLGLCYRSPSSSTDNNECLLKMLDQAISKTGAARVLILGDFNYPEIDYENGIVLAGEGADSSKFFVKTQELCLAQVVNQPTRVRQGQQPSLLDYIFTDEEETVQDISYEAPLGKSDHVVLKWNIILRAKEVTNSEEKLNFWKGNYETISTAVQGVDWKQRFEGRCVDDMWEDFKSFMTQQMEENIPLRVERKKRGGKELSRSTRRAMEKRDKLWNNYQQFPSGRNFEEYRKARNKVNGLVKKDVRKSRKKLLRSFKGKPKRFYGFMRSMQTIKENVVALQKDNEELTASDQETADLLGCYFASMFTLEHDEDMPNEDSNDFGWDDRVVDLSTEAVLKKLQGLSPDKAPGPDKMHPLLLKECAVAVAEPLSLIYRRSFTEGVLPTDWKSAAVVPIFKKGTRTDRANYRPISLTPVCCKVMESLIKDKLLHFLEEHDTISSEQHGFMHGRSCLTNLLEALESWTTALDEGWGIDIIYLDYRKAFDSVPPKRLIKRLQACGLSGNLLKWIESFVTGRKMRVTIRGFFSEWIQVLSGVPQGSVLGPLLFLLFVNELPNWIVTNMKMFADDTKLWTTVTSISDSQQLQQDLESLSEWSKRWLLKFNSSKCKVMHVGHDFNTRYYMQDETGLVELQAVTEEKDLGVQFTSDLKPGKQCITAAAKARRILGMVRRNFRDLDKEEFLIIYKTYIRPHLEYCIQAWAPHLAKDIETLERVQRAATKLVPSLRKCSYEERLRRLGITTLRTRRERGDLIETYKIMTGKERVDQSQFFQLARNEYSLRGHSLKVQKERSRLDIRRFSFSQRVVNNWNRLPQQVVNAESINQFKNLLDRHWRDMDVKSQAA